MSALLTMAGCSSSDPGGNDDDSGDAGGAEDGGNGMMDDGDVSLGDGVAGQACESDDDCGDSGSCLDSLVTIGGDLGSLAGLTRTAPGGYCSTACTSDDQCGEGGVCSGNIELASISGQCEKACEDDGDCRDGYVCTSLTSGLEDLELPEGGADMLPEGGIPQQPTTCRPEPATASLGDDVAGSACEVDEDCQGEGGECLDTVGGLLGFGGDEAPGGYCSGDCTEDADCGAGGLCLGGGSALFSGSCRKACEADDDCPRDGYRCVEAGLGGTVLACEPAAPALEDGLAGAACASDDDCGVGTCASTAPGSDETPEGGFCTYDCSNDTDCGAGGACVWMVGNNTFSTSCAEICDVEAQDCSREGYSCVAQTESMEALMGAVELSPYCQLQASEEPATCDPACESGQVCQDGTCVAEGT